MTAIPVRSEALAALRGKTAIVTGEIKLHFGDVHRGIDDGTSDFHCFWKTVHIYVT